MDIDQTHSARECTRSAMIASMSAAAARSATACIASETRHRRPPPPTDMSPIVIPPYARGFRLMEILLPTCFADGDPESPTPPRVDRGGRLWAWIAETYPVRSCVAERHTGPPTASYAADSVSAPQSPFSLCRKSGAFHAWSFARTVVLVVRKFH